MSAYLIKAKEIKLAKQRGSTRGCEKQALQEPGLHYVCFPQEKVIGLFE